MPASTFGIDGQQMDGTMEEFLGYVRRNYLVGDKVTLNVLRDGKKLELRLLPTPLYRYPTAKTGVIDGALFTLV